eukprot:1077377-Alexandrium_andersonii.AAC.1
MWFVLGTGVGWPEVAAGPGSELSARIPCFIVGMDGSHMWLAMRFWVTDDGLELRCRRGCIVSLHVLPRDASAWSSRRASQCVGSVRSARGLLLVAGTAAGSPPYTTMPGTRPVGDRGPDPMYQT